MVPQPARSLASSKVNRRPGRAGGGGALGGSGGSNGGGILNGGGGDEQRGPQSWQSVPREQTVRAKVRHTVRRLAVWEWGYRCVGEVHTIILCTGSAVVAPAVCRIRAQVAAAATTDGRRRRHHRLGSGEGCHHAQKCSHFAIASQVFFVNCVFLILERHNARTYTHGIRLLNVPQISTTDI